MSSRNTPWWLFGAAAAAGATLIAGYMAYANAAEAEAKAHAARVAANKAASAKRDAERAAARQAEAAAAAGSPTATPSAPSAASSSPPSSTSSPSPASPSALSSPSEGEPCDNCDCDTDWPEGSPEDTVGEFDLHLMVHTGTEAATWAPRLEEEDSALGVLLRALGDAAKTAGVKAKITAVDAPSKKPDSFDVTVWPQGRLYHAASPANARNLLAVLADPNAPVARVVTLLMKPEEVPAKPHVYVCVHAARDERCGTKGGAVYSEFQAKGGDSIVVAGCSHVGGHKYAGNVLVYPAGGWYGYVTPRIAASMSAAMAKGEPLEFPKHRRGQTKWASA